MRTLITLITFMAMAVAACSDADTTTSDPASGEQAAGQSPAAQGGAAAGSDQSQGTGQDSPAIEPEPAGPVEPNTIRIGSQVWKRTLPMTTGQCFLFKEDGTLPTSGVAWGTLDGNEDLHFSAKLSQDGTFESDVNDGQALYWVAGERSPGVHDLAVDLDFDTQTISGHGTYESLVTGKRASGSFEFTCEE